MVPNLMLIDVSFPQSLIKEVERVLRIIPRPADLVNAGTLSSG
jgi:hypothetical protein